jgi:hypothetical protein
VPKHVAVLIIVMSCNLLSASARGYCVYKNIHDMNNSKYMSIHRLGYGMEVRSSNPVEASNFAHLQNVQTVFGSHSTFYFIGTGVLSR